MQSQWRVACVRIPRFPIGAAWQRAIAEGTGSLLMAPGSDTQLLLPMEDVVWPRPSRAGGGGGGGGGGTLAPKRRCATPAIGRDEFLLAPPDSSGGGWGGGEGERPRHSGGRSRPILAPGAPRKPARSDPVRRDGGA